MIASLASLSLVALALQQGAAPDTIGGRYWQQHVRYDIGATLDESSGVLSGDETIVYVNHSPDTLTSFALHLYLNAFRPGSRWADADSVEGNRRFNDLKDPDYGFNHVRDVRIMGQPVEPIYPFAPDSTVVRFELPRPLAPGDSMIVAMTWDARPSTVPRRQGRAGRRFDFAQWYPKVVVYDTYGWEEHPLYPAGEFYGEFGDFLVRLNVPEDQVIGATGIPVCGDPGWERANADSAQPVEYGQEAYPDAPREACGRLTSARGRKTVVWYARDVHHFAMSLNPAYRYEGGRQGNTLIHVLYQPGDSASWGNGIAVKRTATALAWLGQLYGPFGWPQITNVHRIEGGGTEFPMMIMDGSADQGLIVHELGHNYTMGLLANNEWREGFMDEGFTSFQSQWFNEAQGRPSAYPQLEAGILMLDLDDHTENTSLVSEAYRDFTSYSIAVYNRGALFFQQLRYIVGDETMHRILQTFYDRWKYKHVDEAKFRAVAQEVCRCDLSTFFGQWLHSTQRYDYAVGRTSRTQLADGRWRTRVEVLRNAPGRIPVEVAVLAAHDTALVRTDGLAEAEWVTLETASKPHMVVVDPRVHAHDWNMLDNRKVWGLPVISTLLPPPGTEFYPRPWLWTRVRRDRLTVGIEPVAWFNDAGGLTVGLRTRDDYLGRFEQNVAQVTYATGWQSDFDVHDIDWYFRAKNPTFLYAPNLGETFDAFNLEGRYGGRAAVELSRRPHLAFGPSYTAGAELRWVRVDDPRYVDPGFWEPVGTVEAALTSARESQGGWNLTLRTEMAGGLVYGRPGATPIDAARNELYGRLTAEAAVRRDLGAGFALDGRAFMGATTIGSGAMPRQRLIFSGADPYQTLDNPFFRSTGALLRREDVNYHPYGGLGLRGFDPRLAASAGIGLSADLQRTLYAHRGGILSRVALGLFGDVAAADLPLTGLGAPDDDPNLFGDAGVGLRTEHHLGDTPFALHVDFPLYVSRPLLAQDVGSAADESVRFRWSFAVVVGR